MVTIQEPGKTAPEESAPAEVRRKNMGGRRAMSYSVPFPGVRYYAFSPEPLAEDWLTDLQNVRQTLPVKLIDERVILL